MPKLSSLELVLPKLNSLNGLKNANNIKCFTLFNSLTLRDIKDIENLTNLEYLTIDKCKNIEDFSILKSNNSLISLGIENCVNIKDVQFVKYLNNLKTIGLIGTSIENGDLTPLENIQYVSIANEKHYNYLCRDFNLIPK